MPGAGHTIAIQRVLERRTLMQSRYLPAVSEGWEFERESISMA